MYTLKVQHQTTNCRESMIRSFKGIPDPTGQSLGNNLDGSWHFDVMPFIKTLLGTNISPLPLSVLLSRWCSWIPFPGHGGICDVSSRLRLFFVGCFNDVRRLEFSACPNATTGGWDPRTRFYTYIVSPPIYISAMQFAHLEGVLKQPDPERGLETKHGEFFSTEAKSLGAHPTST